MATKNDLLKRRMSLVVDTKFPSDSMGTNEIRYAAKRFVNALTNVGYTEDQVTAMIQSLPEISDVRQAS